MTDPDQINRLEAMIRMLLDERRPQITFAEISERLSKSPKATQLWIKAHGLKRVGPRSYRTTDFVIAATRRHKD